MQEDTLIPVYNKPFRSLLIFGPPGSGKGTLGRILSLAGNHVHLSSGDIFRSLSPESPAGKLFHTYAGKGHLVPDHVTISIVRNYISGLIATNRYFPEQQFLLLDGLPRTLPQASLIAPYIEVVKVIVLQMNNIDALVSRMKRRALVENRKDDMDENVLKTRFEVYENETKQLLSAYPQDKIVTFKADQKPLEVLGDVLSELSSLLSYPERGFTEG